MLNIASLVIIILRVKSYLRNNSRIKLVIAYY